MIRSNVKNALSYCNIEIVHIVDECKVYSNGILVLLSLCLASLQITLDLFSKLNISHNKFLLWYASDGAPEAR